MECNNANQMETATGKHCGRILEVKPWLNIVKPRLIYTIWISSEDLQRRLIPLASGL
jgi:hypothetical protein